ncbi:oligopeptide/dipeptide ABC transporter ATP-binding protein [Nitrospirillum sp. BR 11163]|uniref:ABC transporter ATP-binding protein n=1 Tax=Nitrospirillum sp. BR 11163 TaxID=3104323 RepID=UPI002AFF345A|nr:oligopeptide/dipeptide ABC transporter ATP-binding protein [Nitrospirillum sp. BR 11163]MEA1674642.1 oligopeptide/dipeptide ABC transporter ATP-binding protein [Nitrospirillum sp. BR 11163]
MSVTTDLLRFEGVAKRYGAVQALAGIDLAVRRAEVVGLVGESGCGKSTLGKAAVQLLPLDAGRVTLDGQDLAAPLPRQDRLARRARIQMVFQDPMASLNPRATVGRTLEQPLAVHGRGTAAERREAVAAMLARVGLRPDMAQRYPDHFSGGQRQRIGIARALMLRPDLVICDEAVSALDVSVRAQVLNLLMDLRAEMGAAYLFISHDLSVVRHIADRVAVMYLGRIVETGTRDELWREPLHPYTRALIAAVPSSVPGTARRPPALAGDPPDAANPPTGCAFHPRCPYATARCREEAPVLRPMATERTVACHQA